MTTPKTLRDYMSPDERKTLGDLPTLHYHCRQKTGVCRPGKTARDRYRRYELLRPGDGATGTRHPSAEWERPRKSYTQTGQSELIRNFPSLFTGAGLTVLSSTYNLEVSEYER